MPQAAPVVPDDSNMLILADYKRRPRRPPFRRVQSVGIGVTSSAQQTSIEAETYTILQSGFCYNDAEDWRKRNTKRNLLIDEEGYRA